MNFNFLSLDSAKNVLMARNVLCFARLETSPMPGDDDREHDFEIEATSKFLVHLRLLLTMFKVVFES